MKYLLFSILLVVNLFSAPTTGYNQLKELVNTADGLQDVLELRTELINSSLIKISDICKNSGETQCTINEPINIIVTQKMLDLGLNEEGNYSFTLGSTFPIPSDTIIFQNLDSQNEYDYSIKLDLTKLDDIGVEEVFWKKDSANKKLTFKDESTLATLTSYVKDNINNISLSVVVSDINDSLNYTMNIKQYDKDSEGVEINSFYKDNYTTFNLSAKADNNGGFINTTISDTDGSNKFEEKETFDKDGNTTNYSMNDDMNWTNGDINDSIYSINTNTLNVQVNYNNNFIIPTNFTSYVAVKQNDAPNINNIIAFGFFDLNNINIDYYGDDSLLAASNSTTDTDKLDIYEETINDDNSITYTKVENVWLSK